MNTLDYIEKAGADYLHTYNRYPVVFDHGEGVHLYDIEGKEYLDFCAGIAVYALGYSNDNYKNALKNQIDKIMHTSNLYYSVPAVEAASALKAVTGMDRVFFTNSGAEAIEGAIKSARKYAYTNDGTTDHEIIAMEHSFHGRTMGALSVTGTTKYREPFYPLIGNVKYAEYNNLDSVKAQITDKTCAIIMETIQGEGGIHPATPEFITGIRKLCDEKGILLILDEIQCGMGRSGYMFAYEKYGVKPDILTVAKAVGCGAPVGAFLMTEEVAKDSLKPGDHGSTYGGNPFACTAINVVISEFKRLDVIDNVKKVGAYLEQALEMLKAEYGCISDRRGCGLIQGLEFDESKVKASDICSKALEKGLIIITASGNVIRFIPPLVIAEEDVDSMTAILKECILECV